MKKRLLVISIVMMLGTALLVAEAPKVKAKKYRIKGHSTAFILVTEVLATHNYGEFRFRYEEDSGVFDEVQAEKIMYEFIAKYKRSHKYSKFSVEDIQGSDTKGDRTSVLKRVVFEQVNKRRKH